MRDITSQIWDFAIRRKKNQQETQNHSPGSIWNQAERSLHGHIADILEELRDNLDDCLADEESEIDERIAECRKQLDFLTKEKENL